MPDTTKTWTATVPADAGGTRLDAFWAARLADEHVSRERVKSWISSGNALVDDAPCTKPGHKLSGGESLSLAGQTPETGPSPEQGDLDILYADEHLAVVVKPAGLTTHTAPGLPGGTLLNRLLHRFPALSDLGGERPGIVHRLDKETSGLMVVALSPLAQGRLSRAFAERRVDKAYLCLVAGRPEPPSGRVEAPIGRDPRSRVKMAVRLKDGRVSLSLFETLRTTRDNAFSLVRVAIKTGRTHQIRVHMAHLGHPLLGDATYGGPFKSVLKKDRPSVAALARRTMLHAYELGFDHPDTGEPMRFTISPPRDFKDLCAHLAKGCLKIVVTGAPGSGKSALTRLLAEQGMPAFSADACVAELYQPGAAGAEGIERRYPGRFLDPETRGVDKAALATAMREFDPLRREIMDMVHPMVFDLLDGFYRANQDKPLAVAEIPLYLEAGFKDKGPADVIVGIRCPDALRLGPLAEAGGRSPETLALLDSWQWPQEDKLKQCDMVVDNPGTPEALAETAADLARSLRRLRDSRWEDWRRLL